MVTTSPDDPAADITWNLTPAAPGRRVQWDGYAGRILYTLNTAACSRLVLDGLCEEHGAERFAGGCERIWRHCERGAGTSIWTRRRWRGGDELGSGLDESNFTGLPSKRVYVMPGSYEDPVTEGIAAGLGYAGVRGTGSLKPCCGANTTLASGYDVLNILSQGMVPNYQGMSYAGVAEPG